jgi:hypothetical protein
MKQVALLATRENIMMERCPNGHFAKAKALMVGLQVVQVVRRYGRICCRKENG